VSARLDIDALYRTWGHSVLRRARQILTNEDDAKEILQEVFVALLGATSAFEGRSSPATYLYAATTNACLTLIRNRKTRTRLLEEHVKPWTTDVAPDSPEARAAVRSALALLDDDEARAAIYYHLDGMSHDEIAGVLGCSRRHAGNLVNRVATRLAAKEAAS